MPAAEIVQRVRDMASLPEWAAEADSAGAREARAWSARAGRALAGDQSAWADCVARAVHAAVTYVLCGRDAPSWPLVDAGLAYVGERRRVGMVRDTRRLREAYSEHLDRTVHGWDPDERGSELRAMMDDVRRRLDEIAGWA